MMAFIKKIFAAVVLAGLALFGYQNMESLSSTISFNFDLYAEGLNYQTPNFPVFFILIAFFLVGMLLTGMHGIYERIARKVELRHRERRIRALEKQLETVQGELTELHQKPQPLALPTKPDSDPSYVTPVETAVKEEIAVVGGEEEKKIQAASASTSKPASIPASAPAPASPVVTPLEEEPTL